MDIRDGFLDAIGSTPLIRLRQGPTATSSARPSSSGSVKDRAALLIIEDAEKRGERGFEAV